MFQASSPIYLSSLLYLITLFMMVKCFFCTNDISISDIDYQMLPLIYYILLKSLNFEFKMCNKVLAVLNKSGLWDMFHVLKEKQSQTISVVLELTLIFCWGDIVI